MTTNEQLLAIIHPVYSHLLPKNIRYLMIDKNSPIIDLYPIYFEEDSINKTVLYKSIPYLPQIDINRIRKALKK